MEKSTGTKRPISGLKEVFKSDQNWAAFLPPKYVRADYKKFKYGTDKEDAELLHPILGATTVRAIKDAESRGAILAKFAQGRWHWCITMMQKIAEEGGGRDKGYSYNKGDMISVVSNAYRMLSQINKEESDRRSNIEYARKVSSCPRCQQEVCVCNEVKSMPEEIMLQESESFILGRD